MCNNENEILYVGQEERFLGYKYFLGFPHLSLKYGLKKLKINPKDISSVAIAGKTSIHYGINLTMLQNYQ